MKGAGKRKAKESIATASGEEADEGKREDVADEGQEDVPVLADATRRLEGQSGIEE